MSWAKPEYSRPDVNQAARVLVRGVDYFGTSAEMRQEFPERGYEKWMQSFETVGNWRSSHSWPLNTFKLWLLNKASYVDPESLVAQRLKRLSSIVHKLRRFPDMKLSQMQDIAGCRAIVASVPRVYELVKAYKRSDLKHKLIHEDDYILTPKDSRYRGVHLIYRYYSDKKNNLQRSQGRSSVALSFPTCLGYGSRNSGHLYPASFEVESRAGGLARIFQINGKRDRIKGEVSTYTRHSSKEAGTSLTLARVFTKTRCRKSPESLRGCTPSTGRSRNCKRGSLLSFRA
jgi:hypothetical protein